MIDDPSGTSRPDPLTPAPMRSGLAAHIHICIKWVYRMHACISSPTSPVYIIQVGSEKYANLLKFCFVEFDSSIHTFITHKLKSSRLGSRFLLI